MMIRSYNCLHASEDPMMDNPLLKEAVLEVFCRYYLSYEAENCFVAVDEQDDAQGYILCAPTFSDYEKRLRSYVSDKAWQAGSTWWLPSQSAVLPATPSTA